MRRFNILCIYLVVFLYLNVQAMNYQNHPSDQSSDQSNDFAESLFGCCCGLVTATSLTAIGISSAAIATPVHPLGLVMTAGLMGSGGCCIGGAPFFSMVLNTCSNYQSTTNKLSQLSMGIVGCGLGTALLGTSCYPIAVGLTGAFVLYTTLPLAALGSTACIIGLKDIYTECFDKTQPIY